MDGGDSESKSFFKCSFGKNHIGQDITAAEFESLGIKKKGCHLCEVIMADRDKFEIKKRESTEYFKGETMPFHTFLRYLMPNNKENPKEKLFVGV